MQKIAVVGGRGTVGAYVVEELRRRGHEVRTPSRRDPSHPVDLTNGRGLDAALEGCDVVVDASNAPPTNPRSVLVDGTRRLLEAEQRATVGHHVCVSIVGIDAVPTKYYAAKLAQESLVEQSPVPWTIVRSTQFHELIDQQLGPLLRRWHLAPSLAARLQPVAAREAAAAIAGVAVGTPLRDRYVVAGPEIVELREIVRQLRAAWPGWAIPLRVPLKPSVGRPLRNGALTTATADFRGTQPFSAWLSSQGSAG